MNEQTHEKKKDYQLGLDQASDLFQVLGLMSREFTSFTGEHGPESQPLC